jgi:hypothetical protein
MRFSIIINDKTIFKVNTNQENYKVNYDIPNTQNNHNVKFVLELKTDSHTVFNTKTNEIIESAQIEITNIKLEDINIMDVLSTNDGIILYKHNYNGYGNEVNNTFDFCMAFNGSASFSFITPIYMWLLENM